MILLDTQVVVWLFQDDARLGSKSEQLIEQNRTGNKALVSAITPWEISMLVDKNRLDLGRDVLSWISSALAAPGVALAPISAEIAVEAGRLTGGIHGDPADRLIVATARVLACPLLTSDRRLLDYGRLGHVRAIDARR